ncbi:hypothetical protein AB4Z22_36760, partial [Paenibacillus sp. TAF58]
MTAQPNMNKKQRAISPTPKKRRRTQQKSTFNRILTKVFRIVITVFILLVAWIVYIQWKVQIAPDQTLPKQVDVGIVLGASLRQDIPSPGLQELRLFEKNN